MSFQFIRDHAGRWPVRLMCRVLEVSASGTLGAAAPTAPVPLRTGRCWPMSVAFMPSIMAVTAVPGCMPRSAPKAGRRAVAASRG